MKTTRKGLRILALTLCMAVMLGMAIPALAANISAYGKVIADDTKVYATADKTTVIGTFAKNDIVGIESQVSAKSVYVVRTSATGTAVGYIEKAAVSMVTGGTLANMKAAAGAAATTGTVYNVKSYVNMREKADTKSKVLTKLNKGVTVTILGESGSFYQVSASGKTGYVSKTYVQVAADTSAPTTGSVGGKDTGAVTVGKGDIKVAPFGSTTPAAIKTAMDKAKKANSDVIGYISINGTNISQPILFKKGDVHYYASRSATKAKSSSGAVYAFYGDMVRNNTITGHNMRVSGTMLHELHYLQEKTLGYTVHQATDKNAKKGSLAKTPSLAVASNALWNVSLFGYNQWQVFAMYETAANEPTSTLKYNINPLSSYTPAQVKAWVEYQKNRSEYKFNVPVSTDDIYLTVYTCGNNLDTPSAQSRIYFFLKAVK